jgi:hypothetical protein
MKIDSNFSIEKDTYSYVLKWLGEPYVDETSGKEITPERSSYFPTIESCLVAYISRKVEVNNKTAEEVLEQIAEIKQIIKDSLKKVK